MSKTAHFFDLDCLMRGQQQAWIVDKTNPSSPLLKMSRSELRLAKSGIYKNKGNKLVFNGVTYYLSDEMWSRIKVLAIKSNINFSNLVISLQEFLNPDLIEEMKFDIDLNIILNLKNNVQDLYLVCSEYTKNTYTKIIDEIIGKLKEEGIVVTGFYFLNENFINQDSDQNQFKKIRLLLQHLLGYKSDDKKFVDTEITKYEIVHYYDESIHTLNIPLLANDVLQMMMNKTDKGLSDVIKDDMIDDTPVMYIHKVQNNEYNPIITKKIKLSLSNVVRKFESFKLFL
jgi:hypothetical protein